MKFEARWASLFLGAVLVVLPSMGQAYEEGPVSNGGSIKGKVTFEGALPIDAVEQIVIAKNPEICGTGSREVVWVDVKDGALRGSFVFIDKIAKGKPWQTKWPAFEGPDADKPVIDQKGCRFNPWAQVVKPGPIIIRHRDPGALHNINTREIIGVERARPVKRTMFNFGQPDPGDIEENLVPRRSPHIAINCEAHNFMFGFMMAPKHPYAVVVGEDGSYSIDDIPPGDYTVKAWHPRFGIKKTKLTVPGGGAVVANFVYSQ